MTPVPPPPGYNRWMTERLKPIWQWLVAIAAIFILVTLIGPAARAKWSSDHARDQMEERYFKSRVR